MLGAVMVAFSIFRAAMFAEPTVTKIEEVVRLVHPNRVYLCDATTALGDKGSNRQLKPIPSSFRTGTCALAERTSPHSKREEEKLVTLVAVC